MQLIERTAAFAGASGETIEKSSLRKRIQMDVGKGAAGSGESFACGGRLKACPLSEALRQVEGRHGKCELLMGVGTGSLASAYSIGDVTALAAEGHFFDIQGYFSSGEGQTIITPGRLRMGELRNQAGRVMLFPVSRFLFMSSEPAGNDDGSCFFGRTHERAPLKEVLAQASGTMEPGNMFAMISGFLDDVEFRPLKPGGPVHGRAFTATREPDSDVVWIKGAHSFQAAVVASFDSASLDGMHAHSTSLWPVFFGGHIARATVGRNASVALLRAHETFSVDRYIDAHG